MGRRTVEHHIAARVHGPGQVRSPSGLTPGIIGERCGARAQLTSDVGDNRSRRRLAQFQHAARVAKVEEDERVTQPVGVAAPAHDLRQFVRAERIETGDLAFVGGRLQVARPHFVAQQPSPRHRTSPYLRQPTPGAAAMESRPKRIVRHTIVGRSEPELSGNMR